MERVLVVEDDSFFRETFKDLLLEDGYEVDVASSGDEALLILAQKDYRVVVTDLMMKGISGLELLSRVKQYDPAIEVIIVTGHANVESAILALKNGARDYLIKPINHDEFKHTVALCIEQRRLLDENLELKGLVSLYQASQTIANCLELERLYKLIVDSLAKEVGVNRAAGMFWEGEILQLKELRQITKECGESVCDLISGYLESHVDNSEFLFIPMEGNKIDIKNCVDIKEAMLLFIRSKGQQQGIIALFNDPGSELKKEVNQKNLHFLMEQTSLAIDNAARFAMARNLANIDELTGLYNYRYLDTALEHEIKRTERYGSNLSLIFLDLDLFKSVNDTHGHLVGSKVLKEVGLLLKKLTREVDFVFRYGGDEYTVILVETGMSGAACVAERIRMSIENHEFLKSEGYNIRLTACLGYSCFPDDSRSKIELLELADQAMYHGKVSGKNMVFHISAKQQ